jgi:hypothetical protein
MLLSKIIEEFVNSYDQDYPQKGSVLVFNKDEIYVPDGDIHGLASHAIKHLIEFESGPVGDICKKIINQIRDPQNSLFKNVYLKSGNEVFKFNSVEVKRQLNTSIILNTLDLVNDKIMNKKNISDQEKFFIPYIDNMTSKYAELVNNFKKDYIEMPNEKMGFKPSNSEIEKIGFEVKSKGQDRYYILKLKNKAILVLDSNGDELTYFKVQENNILDYFSPKSKEDRKIVSPEVERFIRKYDESKGSK